MKSINYDSLLTPSHILQTSFDTRRFLSMSFSTKLPCKRQGLLEIVAGSWSRITKMLFFLTIQVPTNTCHFKQHLELTFPESKPSMPQLDQSWWVSLNCWNALVFASRIKDHQEIWSPKRDGVLIVVITVYGTGTVHFKPFPGTFSDLLKAVRLAVEFPSAVLSPFRSAPTMSNSTFQSSDPALTSAAMWRYVHEADG